MDELDPELEDCFIHEIYIEFRFEEWPLLTTLEAESRQRLCAEISNTLAAVECKVLAIRVRSYALQMVLKMDASVSVDAVYHLVKDAGRTVAKDPSAEPGPLSYAVETIGPSDTIDAVMRLSSDCRNSA